MANCQVRAANQAISRPGASFDRRHAHFSNGIKNIYFPQVWPQGTSPTASFFDSTQVLHMESRLSLPKC
jgi:hypothetical protein